MDLNRIKEILELKTFDDIKEKMILNVIAEDEKAVPYVLSLLEIERIKNKDLIKTLNALTCVTEMSLNLKDKKTKQKQLDFIKAKLTNFYIKFKNLYMFNNPPDEEKYDEKILNDWDEDIWG